MNVMAVFNFLGPVILNGVNFFTIPIFTRLLGTANFGIITIYTAWVQIFTVIVGLQTGGSIAVAKVHLPEDEQNGYRSSVLFLSFSFFITVLLGIVLFMSPMSAFTDLSPGLVWLMLIQSFGAYVISFMTLVFTYDKKAMLNFILSMVTAGTTIALSLFLISRNPVEETRYYSRIIGMAAPNIAVGAVLFITCMVKGRKLFSKVNWKFCIPVCLPLIFHGLSHILLSQTGKLMLQRYTENDSTVGIYGLSVTVAGLVSIVWSALNNTWVPFYYDDMKTGNYEDIKRKTKNYMFLFTAFVAAFLFISPEMITIMASKDFHSAVDTMPFLILSMYMVFLYSFPVNYQFFHKKTIYIALGTAATTLVNFLLNLILIPLYGSIGSAISSLIAYIFLFIAHMIIAKKFIKNGSFDFKISSFFRSVLAVAAATGLYFLLKDYWMIRWAFAAAAGILAVLRIIKNRSIF